MSNSILKDKEGNILNPKIPRYELLKQNIKNNDIKKTGQMVNGKEEYVMFIPLGILPNNSANLIDIGLTGKEITLSRMINGYAVHTDGIQQRNIPDISSNGLIRFYLIDSGFYVHTNYNATSWKGYVFIYFTYNS